MIPWWQGWLLYGVGALCGIVLASLGAAAKHKAADAPGAEAPKENAYLKGYGQGWADAAKQIRARAMTMAPRATGRLLLLDAARRLDAEDAEPIFKYELQPFANTDLLLPLGSVVRHVALQDERACLWVQHDLSQPRAPRTYATVPTGGYVPPDGEYVGTAVGVSFGMPWVLHVFDVTPHTEVTP